ncbi:hypothetical protein MRM75_06645 [bacterium 19CA06SA08-2]|uniref:Uncharacterized protein n=1 Tax=bacterium 19CA06SA08-2 TaxID=2920658 RepID=A0AAU6U929_UNCXX
MNKNLTGWLRGTTLLVLACGAGAALAGNKSIPIQVTVTNVNHCDFYVPHYDLTVAQMLVPDGDERTSDAVAVGVHCTRPLPVQLQIALQGHDDATLADQSDPAVTARIELKGAAGEWEALTPDRMWACTEASQCDLQLRAKVRADAKASSGEKQLNGTLLLSVIID